jgi:8-oxo-dGTP pyrophosphatase MutT (NUDIX family)
MMSELSISLPVKELQSLLDGLIRQAQQTAHPGSARLRIGGHLCGWVFPAAAIALKDLSGVTFNTTEMNIGDNLACGEELDRLLATVANTLRAAGCAPGWRNELLDVWAEPGPESFRIGAIERGVMRPLGLITRAVHLNAWSANGGLWVARRALTKATDPGMWDTLVGGLIGSEEDIELALVRETDEEAGLDAADIAHRSPLRVITRMNRRIPEGLQVEDVLTCECVLPAHLTPKNRDGEVMDIQCLAPEVVFEMLQQGKFTVEASIVIAEDLHRRARSN